MRTFNTSEAFPSEERGCVLTIGNFDGLHLGHLALIEAVVSRSGSLGVRPALYTFDPHPRQVLDPERTPPRLMSWAQVADGLEQHGIELVVREPFTREFAKLSAEEFLDDVIVARIGPVEIFVGRDFRFGKGREGSGEILQELAPKRGIEVTIVSQVCAGDLDVSSTRIRNAIKEGDVVDAALCLGRPYAIRGVVVQGDHRGRTLGFPTANLELRNELVPASGVYATEVKILSRHERAGDVLDSVTNIGTRPTFTEGQRLTETHCLDFDSDLYGAELEVEFVARIRDEHRFSGPEELKQQIARDADAARTILAHQHS